LDKLVVGELDLWVVLSKGLTETVSTDSCWFVLLFSERDEIGDIMMRGTAKKEDYLGGNEQASKTYSKLSWRIV
jgi:hypothetical protein